MSTRVGIVVSAALVATAAAAPATRPPPARTPALLAAGKAIYEGTKAGCSACHGVRGDGNGPVAFAVKPPPRNLVKDPFKNGDSVERIYDTVTNGLPNTRMVGYPNLGDDERWALAYYVRQFRERRP